MTRRHYFKPSDFASVARRLAQSEDPSVIAARKQVVEERFKPLHLGLYGMPSLGQWARNHGMDAHWHWDRGHLTNVYWPYPEANGGWVDYLRMGYGKPERLVRELARRGQLKTLGPYGETDHLAFHQVTQLQVGLSEDLWWINWYQDRSAWLEQNNWLTKVRRNSQERQRLVDILESLQAADYAFSIYISKEVTEYEDYDDAEEFLSAAETLRHDGEYTSFSVELRLEPDGQENDEATLPQFVITEFERLLPLYRFTSWDPRANNALGI